MQLYKFLKILKHSLTLKEQLHILVSQNSLFSYSHTMLKLQIVDQEYLITAFVGILGSAAHNISKEWATNLLSMYTIDLEKQNI